MKKFIEQTLEVLNIVLKVGTWALVILSLINFLIDNHDTAIYQLIMAVLLEVSSKDYNPYKE